MLLIRIWKIDEDTNKRKFGSRWFNYDDPDERDEMMSWLNEFEGRFYQECKYVKENK